MCVQPSALISFGIIAMVLLPLVRRRLAADVALHCRVLCSVLVRRWKVISIPLALMLGWSWSELLFGRSSFSFSQVSLACALCGKVVRVLALGTISCGNVLSDLLIMILLLSRVRCCLLASAGFFMVKTWWKFISDMLGWRWFRKPVGPPFMAIFGPRILEWLGDLDGLVVQNNDSDISRCQNAIWNSRWRAVDWPRCFWGGCWCWALADVRCLSRSTCARNYTTAQAQTSGCQGHHCSFLPINDRRCCPWQGHLVGEMWAKVVWFHHWHLNVVSFGGPQELLAESHLLNKERRRGRCLQCQAAKDPALFSRSIVFLFGGGIENGKLSVR